MADIGLSAFSLFFMQSPSFLAHQRRLEEGQGRSNCQTLFGLDKIPSDNHVRTLLDPVSPDHFHPVFAEVVTELERSDGLEAFRQLGGHVLIALDGTEYHVSSKVHCQQCSTRKRGQDRTEHFHAMVSATLVAPDHNRVVPLEPEFIVPQDGHDKQDCESRAVRRWLERHGRRHARLKPIYLGDDLFSRQPVCEAVRAVVGHFLFVCKPSSHQTIEEYLTGIDLPTLTHKVKRGRE
ncbi:MAG TPA: ISNCY family transposase, partial [Pyrinomonadaceae bacterium]|nr:ISNCY family transposase [Pyrinomonadaceae bacterium]